MINKEKSAVLFSKNTNQQAKDDFFQVLGLTQEAKSNRYLGLPIYMGRSKTRMFAYSKDKSMEKNTGVEGKASI